MIIAVGRPPPWPDLVSMRISTGASPAWHACSLAAYLKLCPGTTRSSWSAVVTMMAGKATPDLRL